MIRARSRSCRSILLNLLGSGLNGGGTSVKREQRNRLLCLCGDAQSLRKVLRDTISDLPEEVFV